MIYIYFYRLKHFNKLHFTTIIQLTCKETIFFWNIQMFFKKKFRKKQPKRGGRSTRGTVNHIYIIILCWIKLLSHHSRFDGFTKKWCHIVGVFADLKACRRSRRHKHRTVLYDVVRKLESCVADLFAFHAVIAHEQVGDIVSVVHKPLFLSF